MAAYEVSKAAPARAKAIIEEYRTKAPVLIASFDPLQLEIIETWIAMGYADGVKESGQALLSDLSDYDGAPYCSDCGARERRFCKCPPRPRND